MSNESFTPKNFFRLNGGLNTEANELSFPDGFSKDEANYELFVDGSRRRRKGLAAETGAGTAKTIATMAATNACQSYLWRNVGSNPDKNIVVTQVGRYMYFANAGETVSSDWESASVDLYAYSDTDTAATVDNVLVTFGQGRGVLFVSGPSVSPFYVEYDAVADEFFAVDIAVRIRDFNDIEDGISVSTEPTGTISADHLYNIRNRGWTQTDLEQYDTDKSKHPSKNSLWFKGFKRVADESTAAAVEKDGTRVWDSTKLEAEAFGQSSAPNGSLFLDPRNTSIGESTAGLSTELFGITTWSFVDGGSSWTITVTTDGLHGITGTPDITISGQNAKYKYYPVPSEPFNGEYSFDGVHTVASVPTTSTFTFVTSQPPFWDTGVGGSWTSQYFTLGEVDTGLVLDRSSGADYDESFSAVEFHAGRVFYAGMNVDEFSDSVMFSQIASGVEKFARCYQSADPTDENFNALTPADGGEIIIPGSGGVVNMLSVRNTLLVFGRNGVWEVNGGRAGVFTADGYGVRQLTEQGCNAPASVELLEDSAVYTGPGGIYIIAPNQFTSVLEVTAVTETTIQTLWNQVPDAQQQKVQTVFEPFTKRAYFAFGADATTNGIDTMLIFDGRSSAFFKYTFDTPTDNVLLSIFRIPNADDTSNNKAFKAIYEASTTTLQVADFDQTSFDDWDGTNGPLPYIVFGDDNVGDWQKRRQAPVVTVYSKRTETGYTDTGTGWDADNASSTLMTPFWDWTDETQWTTTGKTAQEAWDGSIYTSNPSVSGKIGQQKEVYRNVRQYVPATATDVDGHPVLVTRNKIRGRGRSLRIRFDGATDKDSHILGFTLNYKVPRRNNT